MSIALINGPGHVPLPTEGVPAPRVCTATQTSPPDSAGMRHCSTAFGSGVIVPKQIPNRYQNRLCSKELLSQAAGIKLHLGVCCRRVFTKHTATQIFLCIRHSQDNSSTSSNLPCDTSQRRPHNIFFLQPDQE